MRIRETYNIENKETDYKIKKVYNDSPSLIVDWKNIPSIDVLQEEIKNGEQALDEQLTKIQEWHSYRDGEINFQVSPSKSSFVYRLVKKQATWQYPNLESAFLKDDKLFLLSDSMPMNRKTLFQFQDLLNYQFTKENNIIDFINRFIRKTIDDGTCIIKLSWDRTTIKKETIINIEDYEDTDNIIDIISENNGDGTMTVLQEFIVKNQPIFEFCDIENVVIDPTAKGDISKAKYILHRFESSLSELKQDGRYSNLNLLTIGDLETAPEGYNELSNLETLSNNGISHIPNKTLIVNEYWGYYDIDGDGISEPVIISWVNDKIIRMEENPYPLQELPFVLVQGLINTNSNYGDSPTELIKDNQDIISATLRGVIDLFAQKAIGQKIIRKGAFDLINKELLQAGEHCEINAEHDPATAIYTTNYEDIPQTVPYIINFFNQEAESLTGVKAFNMGVTGDAYGNMLDIATEIPMEDGSIKLLGDIVAGDRIVGSNGKGTTVLVAHKIKEPKRAFDITFRDGRTIIGSVKSGGEHLWTVKVLGTKHSLREWHTVDTVTIYNHIQNGRTVVIPKIQQIHNIGKLPTDIDPYMLGYWLGNGNSHSSRITTIDEEVIEHFKSKGFDCIPASQQNSGKAITYDVYRAGVKNMRSKTSGCYISNKSFHSQLKELGLLARYAGGKKHIPPAFFNCSYEDKMELIRGLMDSDGYHCSGSFVRFTQSEGRLKDDFLILLKSMGLKASIIKKTSKKMNKAKLAHSKKTGTKMIWARKDAYEIGFTPCDNPFKISRKANNWIKPRIKTITIHSMTEYSQDKKGLMRCLTVDAEDRLYAVTDKFILTHNTATGVRSAVDAITKREASLLRNLSNALIQLAIKVMRLDIELLSDEEIMLKTGQEQVFIERNQYQPLFGMNIDISTPIIRMQKADRLAFLLQTNGNNMDAKERRLYQAQISRLEGEESLAKSIMDFEPQGNPLQDKLLQLEIQEKEAKIEREKAMTNYYIALAKQASSDKDLKDLEFKQKIEGDKVNDNEKYSTK